MLDEFVMCIRGFEAGIVALHIHLPTTSTTDFPEIQEPDLEGQHTGCVDEIARHFTGEVPVQKVKTEAWGVHRRANEVLSQRQFCRAVMGASEARSLQRCSTAPEPTEGPSAHRPARWIAPRRRRQNPPQSPGTREGRRG